MTDSAPQPRAPEPAATPALARLHDWWSREATVAAVAAVLLGLMTWQVLIAGPMIGWDWSIHTWADQRQPDGAAKFVLDSAANVSGQRLYTLPVVLGVAYWVSRRQATWRPLVAIVIGLGTVFVVGYAIKLGLGRTSPGLGVDLLHAGGQAFPSGHTANATLSWAFVVVVLLGSAGLRPDRRRFRRWIVLPVTIALLAGGLMTVLDYHWFSDVIGGWLLGLLALMVTTIALRRLPESVGIRVRSPGR